MSDAQPQTWLAVSGPGDYVKLLPVEGVGPDVFVKYSDYQRVAEELAELRRRVGAGSE